MAIFDIFSTSFLFSIAIILLFCGSLFIYFNCKIDKQNHKLTSMVNLVSILAQDLQFVNNKLASVENEPKLEKKEETDDETVRKVQSEPYAKDGRYVGFNF